MKRRVVDKNTTFSHHFLQITQAKVIGQIPAHALGDDIDGILQSLEGISDQRHGQVTSLKKTACYLTTP